MFLSVLSVETWIQETRIVPREGSNPRYLNPRHLNPRLYPFLSVWIYPVHEECRSGLPQAIVLTSAFIGACHDTKLLLWRSLNWLVGLGLTIQWVQLLLQVLNGGRHTTVLPPFMPTRWNGDTVAGALRRCRVAEKTELGCFIRASDGNPASIQGEPLWQHRRLSTDCSFPKSSGRDKPSGTARTSGATR